SNAIVVCEEFETPTFDLPPVSHAFVVTGEDQAESAEAKGVMAVRISDYLADRACRVYFRRPRAWGPELGATIAAAAQSHDGEGYGYALIVAHLLHDNPVGKLVDWVGRGWPNHWVSKWCDRARTEICSELAVKALQAAWLWALRVPRGCLGLDAREVA